MPKSASVDANVLLDWLLQRDTRRTNAAASLFKSVKDLHIADLTIAEMVYVLASEYEVSRPTIVDFMNRIVNEEVFNCNRALIRKALRLYESEPKLSWVDCCAVFYAELNNALPLYTFDKDLIKKSAGKAKLPA